MCDNIRVTPKPKTLNPRPYAVNPNSNSNIRTLKLAFDSSGVVLLGVRLPLPSHQVGRAGRGGGGGGGARIVLDFRGKGKRAHASAWGFIG